MLFLRCGNRAPWLNEKQRVLQLNYYSIVKILDNHFVLFQALTQMILQIDRLYLISHI